MGTYVTGTGSIAGVPELHRDDEGGVHTHVRVIVAHRSEDVVDQWAYGAATGYDVLVRGKDAESLVAIARDLGIVEVVFAGPLRETPASTACTASGEPSVAADVFGYSAVGQTLTITRGSRQVVDDEPPS